MPAPTTIDEFLTLVRKSNLLDDGDLGTYLAAHPGPYANPTVLARKMRSDGLLGKFHVEQLLRGKYRGFFLGKHRLIDRIGFGGMGQVFLAEHMSLRRKVAIKVLPPNRALNEFSRERFLREARAAGQLDHPNLVRAFDVDCEGDVYFLVMEYVDGISFHDLVSRHGPLDPDRTASYLWQAAAGLAYLNGRGMVHRDVKPANLLVDRQGVVKLLDLGLVRSQEEPDDLTRNEGVKILGTADYLAPEQALECSRVDVRADIYSLGATGYFLLTGRPPFDGTQIAQKLIAHQTKAVKSIREVRPDVPPELAAIIEQMLAKRPADRYQTPDEVIADLHDWAPVALTEASDQFVGAAGLPPVLPARSSHGPARGPASAAGSHLFADLVEVGSSLRHSSHPSHSRPRSRTAVAVTAGLAITLGIGAALGLAFGNRADATPTSEARRSDAPPDGAAPPRPEPGAAPARD